jgi:ferrous iron transport protein B
VQRAGTLIFIVSVIIWALSWLPSGNIESSLLALVGHALSPLGAAMGLEWRLLLALLTSFVAKENTIATLGILVGSGSEGGLAQALPALLTPASALAFLVVQVLFIPCAATVAAIRQETRSWGWTLFSVASLFDLSFAAGIAVYQALSLV